MKCISLLVMDSCSCLQTTEKKMRISIRSSGFTTHVRMIGRACSWAVISGSLRMSSKVCTYVSCDGMLFPEYFCRLGMNEAYQQLADACHEAKLIILYQLC
jgi:hypothetical protein